MTMSRQEDERPKREERKKARKESTLLLERLRELCKVIDRVSDWQDVVGNVEELLTSYHDVVPIERRHRIRKALELPEATLKGVQQACQVLQVEVEGLIRYLKPVPAVGTVLTVGLIIVAVGVFAVTVVSNVVAVDVVIHNQGCGDIPVAEAIDIGGIPLAENPLLDAFGIRLPAVIKEGSTQVLSLPPIDLEVDNRTESSELMLRASGQELRVPITGATGILFDGESILGRQRVVHLGSRRTHELTIRCQD
jgi:hypothetical protein